MDSFVTQISIIPECFRPLANYVPSVLFCIAGTNMSEECETRIGVKKALSLAVFYKNYEGNGLDACQISTGEAMVKNRSDPSSLLP